jgi:hypothetical protein
VNAVRITKAHLRTGDSGVLRLMSTTTKRSDGTVKIHHSSIAPSSMRNSLKRLSGGHYGYARFVEA